MSGNDPSLWRVVGGSVRGASHIRAGLPNQDALRWLPEVGHGTPLVVAVSDGHGSAKSFRSERGSMLAVLVATQVCQEFLDGLVDAPTLSAVKRAAEDRLPQEVARRWREAVDENLALEPLTEDELTRLAGREGEKVRGRIAAMPHLAYGATLVTTVVTPDFLLYLQLGDGDILTVSDAGAVTRPLTRDTRLFANETTSLSGKDAWRDAQVVFQALSGPPPALILMATDGYANSFRDEAGFIQVGVDLLDMIRSDGLDLVRDNLETWLTEASEAGSGDDITLALLTPDLSIQKSDISTPTKSYPDL